ncbi:MAG: flavodoxin-dependent (E)-4-hydroxy-3-methylbut-2-enyl-diphosphate synthase, partial [Bacteroidota bacterium]
MTQMLERDMVYPLHLGVTEAGEGEDGRIKSALGIATLLLDGMGDTVRVSLTEEPEHETPVAEFLVNHIVKQVNTLTDHRSPDKAALPFDPYAFKRRESDTVINLGKEHVPRVVADMRGRAQQASDLQAIGYTYMPLLDKYNFADMAADYAYFGTEVPAFDLPGGLKRIYDHQTWRMLSDRDISFPYFANPGEFAAAPEKSDRLNFVALLPEQAAKLGSASDFEKVVFILLSENAFPTYDWRKSIYQLSAKGIQQPTILRMQLGAEFSYYNDDTYPEYVRISEDAKTQLALASNGSTMLVDGLTDGLWVDQADACRLRTAFGMLQLSRLRITKTEYISCPSCGRTLFDLQETTARIRKRTEHLKGVKIGIMGCIVNGPGEMADADYGYVGVGPDKIALYRGQEVVEKGVKTAEAVDKLIDLIRGDGKWVEPEPTVV